VPLDLSERPNERKKIARQIADKVYDVALRMLESDLLAKNQDVKSEVGRLTTIYVDGDPIVVGFRIRMTKDQ
jgi:hypothetical protein